MKKVALSVISSAISYCMSAGMVMVKSPKSSVAGSAGLGQRGNNRQAQSHQNKRRKFAH